MRKTLFFKTIVIFCIILSFFGSVNAGSTGQFNISDTNVEEIKESDDRLSTTIIANASTNTDKFGTITFTAKYTGVYTIDVESYTNDYHYGEDICYVLVREDGSEVRLAAVDTEEYMTETIVTLSDKKDSNVTKIDVILESGQTYKLYLSKSKTKPNTSLVPIGMTTFVNDDHPNVKYKIGIDINTDTRKEVFQSDKSSQLVSNRDKKGDDVINELEPNIAGYKIKSAKLEGYTFADFVGDTGEFLDEWVGNPLEETFCDLLLGIGDFFVFLINEVVGEEVTVTSLVYNLVDAVNANFFDSTVSANGMSATVRTVVNDWYNAFKMIAIAVYIVVLLGIGIHVLLASTADGMQKFKELVISWLKGVLILVFVPYLIKYAFSLNEAVVDMLRVSSKVSAYPVGSGFGNADEWSAEEIEFRSPEYVSKYTGNVIFGSDEATQMYTVRLRDYEQNMDLMRIMRAYAGLTKRFVYVIIWYILIGQLISFIVQYYKRYFMIAFLIAVFPIICIFHAISIAKGKPQGEIGSWMKEILSNIFMQMIQAIIYTLITGVCVSIVQSDIHNSGVLNWLLLIMAINYVSEGEKLMKKILGAIGNTSDDSGKSGTQIKRTAKKVGQEGRKIFEAISS